MKNHLTRTGLALGLFLLVLGSAQAQDDREFDDLQNLYLDEKYEKLIQKGEKYLGKTDTRKNPAPYLYLSKAYYEISRMEDMHEDYPPEKAFSNALKWATKYRKKDPEGVLFRENDLYFEELKKVALEEAAGFMADQKFSRAKRYYDAITKFDPDDAGAWFLLGLTQVEMRSMTEAGMAFAKGEEALERIDVTRLTGQDKKILLMGGLEYAEYQMDEGNRTAARTTLDRMAPAFEGDNEFDMLYRKVK